MKLTLPPDLAADLAGLYRDMEQAYDRVAEHMQHTCDGCPDNCCDSYFTHHTYIEWAYLRLGMAELSDEWRREVVLRARSCITSYEQAERQGKRPQIMCPVNEAGRCLLYQYRLMVCRTHGVPAIMTRPDGRVIRFPGCFRCQERIALRSDSGGLPVMERTSLLLRLVELEQRFLHGKRARVPRLAKTIAEMVISEPGQRL
jgi:hypothetical protein